MGKQSGSGAKRHRDAGPVALEDVGGGQVQHDTAHRDDHMCAELMSRSRKVDTCARAHAAPAARSLSSCISTWAATVINTRSWLAQNRLQLVRSISSPW